MIVRTPGKGTVVLAAALTLSPLTVCPASTRPKPAPGTEEARLTYAPEVPPPLSRRKAAVVVVRLESGQKEMELGTGVKYRFWTFNGRVSGTSSSTAASAR